MEKIDNFYKFVSNIDTLSNVQMFIYGKSFMGENLYAFHKGSYLGKQLLITGGMHAREFISTAVVTQLIKDYNLSIGCYFVPLINPDGVRLCTDGLSFVSDKDLQNYLLRLNKHSTDFSLWKANIRGVDLNVNFDASWGSGKFVKYIPSSSGFCGESPLSELENINLLNFLEDKNIAVSLAYHSKGEVVYYGFEELCENDLAKAKKLAKVVAKSLRYKIVQSKNSTGGLSDYLAYNKKIPSCTIELGNDNYKHPIGLDKLQEVYCNQIDMIKNVSNFLGI